MNLPLPLGLGEQTFWLPVPASEQAADIDWLYYYIYWVCVVFFVGVVASMLWFMWAYRRRPGHAADQSLHHNLPLELFWSVVPTILVVFMFYWGFTGFIAQHTAPADAYKIEVLAKKWDWTFIYPNGATVPGANDADPDDFSKGLHVPPGRPVQLLLAGQDVLHAFYSPEMRVKQDAVPGRITQVWFTAIHSGRSNQPEVYPLFCAEYCGTKHSLMRSKVVVHPTQESFDQWVKERGDIYTNRTPEQIGETLYQINCQSCHSTSDIKTVGPGFGQLARRLLAGETREVLVGGSKQSVKVDEAYFAESIKEPNAKIVAEVPAGGMTPGLFQQLERGDQDVQALLAYIKSLAGKQ